MKITNALFLFITLGCFASCSTLKNVDKVRQLSEVSTSLSERMIVNINADWQYLEDNTSNINDLVSTNKWQPIDLPHTWNLRPPTLAD